MKSPELKEYDIDTESCHVLNIKEILQNKYLKPHSILNINVNQTGASPEFRFGIMEWVDMIHNVLLEHGHGGLPCVPFLANHWKVDLSEVFTVSTRFLTIFQKRILVTLTKLPFTIWNLVKAFQFINFAILLCSPRLSTDPLSTHKIVEFTGIFDIKNCFDSHSYRQKSTRRAPMA